MSAVTSAAVTAAAPGRPPPAAPAPNRGRDRASAFAVSAAVAVLYAALGLIATTLGQLTGIAAPVWPAAGVAVAAALRWRWRALPGVFLGSACATVVSVLWLTGVDRPAPRIWLVAAAVGVGAVLGAAAAAVMVHRCVGPVQRLDTPRAVMATLGLAGLLATTIPPTVGVTAQLAAGLLQRDQAGFGWLTWWVGDAIGVVVFAPLVLMALPSQNRYWAGRRWKVAVPSLLVFGILMAAVVQNVAAERTRIDSAVQQLGDKAAAELSRNIAVHQEVLEGVRGLVLASDEITAGEFEAYVTDVFDRFPNLQAVSWNPVVTEAGLAAFEARQRAQPGLRNFTVTERDADGDLRPVRPRPEYVVVAYIEPLATNRTALGYDIYSTPARAAAIDTARDTGQPTATSPVDLVQESGTQKGMLALLPVYDGGADPGSDTARRAELRGFAVGVYRLRDLLAETFSGPEWNSVDVSLVDVTDAAGPIVIADLPARAGATDGRVPAATATTAPLDIYGRSWELTVHPTSAAFIDSRSSLIAILLLAALAMTLFLEAFLLVLSGMESLARRLMSEISGAARYVTSILPDDQDAPVPIASRYIPSDELGGDSFDHRWIDDDHLIAYLADVSGHGIAPAMFSVSVHNLLRSGTLDTATLADPGRVLSELNGLFQMDQHQGNYFTLWYGVYQPSTGTLRYAGAGHPPAVVLPADGSAPVRLASESIPIGILEDTDYRTGTCVLRPADTLLIYSDGAFDLTLPDGRHGTVDDFVEVCARTARTSRWTLDELVDKLRKRSASGRFDDDCTLVRVTAR